MSQRKSGVALLLSLATCGASVALLVGPQASICTNRPSLTVLAMVAAFVLAMGIRLLRLDKRSRSLLLFSSLLAFGTLAVNARFVFVHRAECKAEAAVQNVSLSLHK